MGHLTLTLNKLTASSVFKKKKVTIVSFSFKNSADVRDGEFGNLLLRTIILGLEKMVCGLFLAFFLSSSISNAQ